MASNRGRRMDRAVGVAAPGASRGEAQAPASSDQGGLRSFLGAWGLVDRRCEQSAPCVYGCLRAAYACTTVCAACLYCSCCEVTLRAGRDMHVALHVVGFDAWSLHMDFLSS